MAKKIKVLIVDDDPEMLLLLRAMLPSEWCTSLSASDGEQALTLARAEHPDVILLDLMLPGMNGLNVLKELRTDSKTADTPIIVLTAKYVTAEEHQLLDGYVQGLMSKTALTPQSLLAELGRLEMLR